MPLFEQNKEKPFSFVQTGDLDRFLQSHLVTILSTICWANYFHLFLLGQRLSIDTGKYWEAWSATADAGVWIILHLVLQYGRLCIFEVFSFLLFDQVPEKEERCTNMVENIKQHRLDVECCTPSVSWTVLEWALISRFVLCHDVAFFSRPACLQALVLHIGNSGSSTFNLGPFTVP